MSEQQPTINLQDEQRKRRDARLRPVELEKDFAVETVVNSKTTADGLSISFPEPSAVSYEGLFEDSSMATELHDEAEVTADELVPEIVPISAAQKEEFQTQHLTVRQRYGQAETTLDDLLATAKNMYEAKVAEACADEKTAKEAHAERIAQLESAKRRAIEAVERMHDRFAEDANTKFNIRRLDDAALIEAARTEHRANTVVIGKIREDIEAALTVQGVHEIAQQKALEAINALVAEYETKLEQLETETADRNRFAGFKAANDTVRSHLYAEENTIIAKKSAGVPLANGVSYEDALQTNHGSQSQNRLDTEVNKQLVAESEMTIAELRTALAELPQQIFAAYNALDTENRHHTVDLDTHSKDAGIVTAEYTAYLENDHISTPPDQIKKVVEAGIVYDQTLAIREGNDTVQDTIEPTYNPNLMLAFIDRRAEDDEDMPSSLPDQAFIRTEHTLSEIQAGIKATTSLRKLSAAVVTAALRRPVKVTEVPVTNAPTEE